MLRDGCPLPAVDRKRAICAPYVDNVNMIGAAEEPARALCAAVHRELEDVGLALRDHQPPRDRRAMLGVGFDGKELCLTARPERA